MTPFTYISISWWHNTISSVMLRGMEINVLTQAKFLCVCPCAHTHVCKCVCRRVCVCVVCVCRVLCCVCVCVAMSCTKLCSKVIWLEGTNATIFQVSDKVSAFIKKRWDSGKNFLIVTTQKCLSTLVSKKNHYEFEEIKPQILPPAH
jgi:hypothetical protein